MLGKRKEAKIQMQTHADEPNIYFIFANEPNAIKFASANAFINKQLKKGIELIIKIDCVRFDAETHCIALAIASIFVE